MKLKSQGNRIVALDNQVNTEPSLIPKMPFSMIVSASKGGGKSTLILNMLLNNSFYNGKFNQIFWISPTAKLDSKTQVLKNTNGITTPNRPLITKINKEIMKQLRGDNTYPKKSITGDIEDYGTQLININEIPTNIPEDHFIENIDLRFLESLMESQKKVIAKFGKELADTILIIFDDCISDRFFKTPASFKYFLNSRHVKCSSIIATQMYHGIPKTLRLNCSAFVLFNTGNDKELKTIHEENNCSIIFKDWIRIYKAVSMPQFGFLVINYMNPLEYRLQNQFLDFIDVSSVQKNIEF